MVLLCLIVLVILLMSGILGRRFLSVGNFTSMAYQLPEFGFMVLGMAVCTLTGGMDLSIVSISTLSGILSAYTLMGVAESSGNVTLAIVLAILVGLSSATVCGVINGLLITKTSILPILATLSTMIFYNGLSMAITTGSSIFGFPEEFISLGMLKVGGIPLVFLLFLAATILIAVMLEKTAFGRKIYLYGTNKTVSMFSGIDNHRVVIKAFMLSGFLCGIAGLIMMSRVNSMKVGYGDTYLLQAILVCVLGGLDPSGGRGKVLGVFLGALVLQVLGSAFTMLKFQSYTNKFIWGIALVSVMVLRLVIDRIGQRRQKRSAFAHRKAESEGES